MVLIAYLLFCVTATDLFSFNFGKAKLPTYIIITDTREHWTGEVSADEWVPVFPVFLLAVGIMKKTFCLYKNDLF